MPTTDNVVKDSVPPSILKRINALRKLQLEAVKMESELFNETFHLEQRFTEKLKPLLEKRNAIINGQYEPNEDESQCSVKLPDDCFVDPDKTNTAWASGTGDAAASITGIPNFWLQVLKNATPVASLIQEYDEPVLESLCNISLEYGEATERDDLKSFTILFDFKPNKYFKNERLTKTYQVRVSPAEDDPFSFEGPEIVGCTGCEIDWYPNMNVTRRTIRRRKTNKSDGKVTIKTESIPRDSFFHFFIPPTITTEAPSDELDELLEEHYEVGHFMREKLIPNAVLLYTGESPDAESEYDEDDDDDDEDDDEDGNTASNDGEASVFSSDDYSEEDDGDDNDGYQNNHGPSGDSSDAASRGPRSRHLPG